jgi:hypothetical protein
MTRVFIDNREIQPPSDASSINRILKYIDDEHLGKNSVVSQIRVNGHQLMPDDLSGTGDHTITGRVEKPAKVEIFTGNIAEIARGSISEALAYLDRIEGLTPSLVESCRTKASPDFFESLKQLYEGFYWLDRLINKLRTDFPIHFENALIRNGFEAEYHRKFIFTLKRLKQSQETGDLSQVSGLLEVEILPLVHLWREMLIGISQKVIGVQ